MALVTKTLRREFFLNGRRLADPNPAFSIDEVRDHYIREYPELNNASYREETTGESYRITFTAAAGTKG